MSDLSSEILKEINNLRRCPFEYVEHLLKYIENFDEGCINFENCEYAIMLEEGIHVLHEALGFAQQHQGGLPPLQSNALLQKAA